MSPTSEPTIHTAIDEQGEAGRVATITVDNTARINILNTPLIEKLTSAIEALHEDERLRALILTGAGERAFIGGADVNEMAGLDPQSARAFITKLHGVCAALVKLPVPVIAKIRGYCLGGGLEIAAACDLRIAAEGSSFGMPEVKVGVPSVIEAALLPRLVGWGKASEIVYTGEIFDCNEALRCGMIEKLVAPEELDSAVEAWVGSLLAAGPRAIRLQKELMRAWERLAPDQAIEASIDVFARAWENEEPRRMMRAFLHRDRTGK